MSFIITYVIKQWLLYMNVSTLIIQAVCVTTVFRVTQCNNILLEFNFHYQQFSRLFGHYKI
jgi:hypothetical protein